jgi:hypothetical protein
MVLPASVPVEGTRRVVFIPGDVADITSITLGEVASGVDVSCYLTGDGWQPSGEQAFITDARLCTTQDIQRFGRKTKGLAIRYVYNLNSPEDDEARLGLEEGTDGILVNVLQKDEDEDDFEAGDWYQAWPVTLGEQTPMPPETNAVDRINQQVAVTGRVTGFEQLAAGS